MDEGEKRPLGIVDVGFAAGLVLVLVAALYVLTHVSIRPINPAQPSPSGHFTAACGLCHSVSASVVLKEP